MEITYRAMRALHWLGDNPRSVVLPEDVCASADARIVYDELESLQLIEATLTADGSFDFLSTATGSRQARNLRDSYRAELAQRRVLEWVRNHNTLSGLVHGDLGADFSGVLTDVEVAEAAQELDDRGLLKGSKQANGEFFYLEVTSTGRSALRSPYPINASAGVSGAPVTNISADNYGTMTVGNQVLGGQGHTVTANVTQGVALEEALEAIGRLRDAVASADADPAEREEVLDDIDGLLRKGTKRGLAWLKTALIPVANHLASVYGQELADQALQIGSRML